MRIFVLAFSKKHAKSTKKTAYASTAHVRDIRKKIVSILTAECAKVSINDLVKHLLSDFYTEKLTKACQYIYPL